MEGTVKTLHLKQEELISALPEMIGRVRLDYSHYPGKDLYSDGAIEDEILSIVKTNSRIEYQDRIEEKNSWPILYHLSPLRANIVEFLPIGKGDKVLEIGSGCGAITQKLSEKAGEVTCVELSAKRSHINAYRNQDKENITIHVGNFKDIEPELACDYDYVCLIGVFEYASSYMQTATPYEDFLQIMKRHVKENGHLVIAIENRLGLKYFAGCKEDHLGTWYSGLEDYPDGGSARTFSKKKLEKLLHTCDLSEYAFYYPYPDYKFPSAIYSDRRLPHQGELTENICNYDRDRLLSFHEKYVYDSLIRDEMFPDFSNSFLVITGPALPASYVKYSNDRAPQYQLYTSLVEEGEKKEIRKYPWSAEAKAHICSMEENYRLLRDRYDGSGLSVNPCRIADDGYAAFPFEKGIPLEEIMDDCLQRDDFDGFYRLFDRYLTLISYGDTAEVSDYDLIFANLLVDGDHFTIIDYEWTEKKRIPVKEIAFRAIYCYVLEEEKRNKLNLDYITEKLGITEKEAEEYRTKEQAFQKKVTGKHKSMGDIRAGIGTYCLDVKKLAEQDLQRILDRRIQVYLDRGQGFSEADSYYMPDVYTAEQTIEVAIPFDGNTRALRIDPADKSCIVKVEELLQNGQAIPPGGKVLTTNGKKIKNGTFAFATNDPNMTIAVRKLPMTGENELSVRLLVSPIPMSMAEDLIAGIKKLF